MFKVNSSLYLTKKSVYVKGQEEILDYDKETGTYDFIKPLGEMNIKILSIRFNRDLVMNNQMVSS